MQNQLWLDEAEEQIIYELKKENKMKSKNETIRMIIREYPLLRLKNRKPVIEE